MTGSTACDENGTENQENKSFEILSSGKYILVSSILNQHSLQQKPHIGAQLFIEGGGQHWIKLS